MIIISQPVSKMKIFCISSQCSIVKNHQITGLLCSLMFTSLWLSSWSKKTDYFYYYYFYWLFISVFLFHFCFPLICHCSVAILSFQASKKRFIKKYFYQGMSSKILKDIATNFQPSSKNNTLFLFALLSALRQLYIPTLLNLKECNFSSFILSIHSVHAGNWTLPKTKLRKFVISYCRETYRIFYSYAIHIMVSQNFQHSWQCYYSSKNDIIFLILLLLAITSCSSFKKESPALI